MRALVLKDWWNLAVEDVPEPNVGPADVLIDVLAVGICGSDIHGYTGESGRRAIGQVMGHEFVGRVSRLGSAVPGSGSCKVGDIVTVNPVIACGTCSACARGLTQICFRRTVIGVNADFQSAFAESIAVPADNVVHLRSGTPVEFGSLVEPLAVGFHGLTRGHCRAGERVLVIGGGPIGQTCILAAQRLGADGVVVVEPSGGRRRLAEQFGATAVDVQPSDKPEAVWDALGGFPTLTVDAVGTSQSIDGALGLSGVGTSIVLLGMGEPLLDISAFKVSTEERSIVGSFCYSRQEFTDTAAWVRDSGADLAPLISGRVELDDANDAMWALAKGETEAMRTLVCPNGVARLADARVE